MKKPDTAHERKSKDAAIGCLIFIVIIVLFAVWAMGL
jgi:hypothetical protein